MSSFSIDSDVAINRSIPRPHTRVGAPGNTNDVAGTQRTSETASETPGTVAERAAVFEAGGQSDGIKGAVKGKLAELMWDKLEDGVDLSVGDTKDGVGLSAQVSARKLGGDELAADPLRDGPWMESVGVVEGGLGLSTSVPVGAFNLNVGFSQAAHLRYRALTPGDDLGSIKDVDLPTSAGAAAKMPVGASVELSGQGTREARAGFAFGRTSTTSAGELHAGAGVSQKRTKRGSFAIEVTRLTGAKVEVTLRDLEERKKTTSANVGVSLELSAPAALTKAIGEDRANKLAGAVGELEVAMKAHKSHRETSHRRGDLHVRPRLAQSARGFRGAHASSLGTGRGTRGTGGLGR